MKYQVYVDLDICVRALVDAPSAVDADEAVRKALEDGDTWLTDRVLNTRWGINDVDAVEESTDAEPDLVVD